MKEVLPLHSQDPALGLKASNPRGFPAAGSSFFSSDLIGEATDDTPEPPKENPAKGLGGSEADVAAVEEAAVTAVGLLSEGLVGEVVEEIWKGKNNV